MDVISGLLPALTVGLIAAGLSYLLRSKTQAAADGVPLAQISPLPERWFDPFRPLAVRRSLVVLWGAVVLGGLLLSIRAVEFAPFVLIAAWWVGIVLSQVVRGMAELGPEMLDERMLSARNRAFRMAYYGLGCSLAVSVLVAGRFDGVSIDQGLLTIGGFTLIIVIFYLPPAILAWTEEVV